MNYLIKDPIEKVALASSNLQQSVDYWNGILGLKIYSKNDNKVLLGFSDDQTKLELEDIGKNILLYNILYNLRLFRGAVDFNAKLTIILKAEMGSLKSSIT